MPINTFRFKSTPLNTGPLKINGIPMLKANGEPLMAGEVEPGKTYEFDPATGKLVIKAPTQ